MWTQKPLKWNYYSISTSNHMFKREIWDKFTKFTYLKFYQVHIFQNFKK